MTFEHIEYFPFGETWIQEGTSNWKVPYMYTSKELDEDTQLYYYGARYYDPRTSVWQSADPILNKYLPDIQDYIAAKKNKVAYLPELDLVGRGGIYNSKNLAFYTYTHQNPVVLIDPDGLATWPTSGITLVPSENSINGGFFGNSRTGGSQFHGGIDIGGKIGDNVKAYKSGTVVRASWENPNDQSQGFGRRIVVEHTDDNGKKTYSVYAHLNSMGVDIGDPVEEGQNIGTLGASGNAANVPNKHLHFEIRQDNYPGNSANNLNVSSQFTFWDKVKTFFRGLFTDGPMFIPDTHVNDAD